MTQAGHNRLAELANVVAAEHRRAEAAARKALEHALAAGDALLEAKSAVEHGQWSAWLAANVPDVSARTAQLYMKLARNRDSLEAQRVANLSLRQAAKMVSQPKGGAEHHEVIEHYGTFGAGFVVISPHAQPGYAHVTIISGEYSFAEGTIRGVRADWAGNLARRLIERVAGPGTEVGWNSVPAQPSSHNPWIEQIAPPLHKEDEAVQKQAQGELGSLLKHIGDGGAA
jgi:hypothetical protein